MENNENKELKELEEKEMEIIRRALTRLWAISNKTQRELSRDMGLNFRYFNAILKGRHNLKSQAMRQKLMFKIEFCSKKFL